MKYQIQVKGAWAGLLGGWRPAIDGEINQTSDTADVASTFERIEDAEAFLDWIRTNEQRGDSLDPDPRDHAPEFRIVER